MIWTQETWLTTQDQAWVNGTLCCERHPCEISLEKPAWHTRFSYILLVTEVRSPADTPLAWCGLEGQRRAHAGCGVSQRAELCKTDAQSLHHLVGHRGRQRDGGIQAPSADSVTSQSLGNRGDGNA